MSPLKQLRSALEVQITPVIKELERARGFKLSMEDFDFLVESNIEFVITASTKFIDGACRHFDENNPNFTDGSFSYVDALSEELVDGWHYNRAEKKRQQKLQKQNKL